MIIPQTNKACTGDSSEFEKRSHDLHNILFAYFNQNDQFKKDEMGRACSKHGGEEECMLSFGGKGNNHYEDLDVDGRKGKNRKR
jgi:hypothetical protein